MFTSQAAETILSFPPFTAKYCVYTHMKTARENKEHSHKRTLNQRIIYLSCWGKHKEVSQNISKEENTRGLK